MAYSVQDNKGKLTENVTSQTIVGLVKHFLERDSFYANINIATKFNKADIVDGKATVKYTDRIHVLETMVGNSYASVSDPIIVFNEASVQGTRKGIEREISPEQFYRAGMEIVDDVEINIANTVVRHIDGVVMQEQLAKFPAVAGAVALTTENITKEMSDMIATLESLEEMEALSYSQDLAFVISPKVASIMRVAQINGFTPQLNDELRKTGIIGDFYGVPVKTYSLLPSTTAIMLAHVDSTNYFNEILDFKREVSRPGYVTDTIHVNAAASTVALVPANRYSFGLIYPQLP